MNKFNCISGCKNNVWFFRFFQTLVAAEMDSDSRENVNAADCLVTIEALKAENMILKESNIQLQQIIISLKDEKTEMQDKCTCCSISSTATGSVQGQNPANLVPPQSLSKHHLPLQKDGNRYWIYTLIKLRLLKCVQSWRLRNWLVRTSQFLLLVNWQGHPILTGNSNVCFLFIDSVCIFYTTFYPFL